jgi:CARDB
VCINYRATTAIAYNKEIVKYAKILVLAVLVLPAAVSFATPNLRSTPITPYGPYLTGQMPLYYYNLLNTGTTDAGTQRPLMNSNWVVVDAYSDNYYPNGRGTHAGWMWVSGNGFGPVPAGGSIVVNNGGPASLPRWPENDWCVPAGTHRVQAFIDNGNNVAETNNSDNDSGWSSFTVNNRTLPAPDLTVAPNPTGLGPFIAGQTATIPFRFSNIGTAVPSALLRARAQIDDFSNGGGWISRYVTNRPVLAVGETRTENFTWPNAVAGTHSVRVTYVDDRFQVDELNDCNNTTNWVTFTVLPANLEARLTSRTVASGAVVSTTSFSIRNIGSITVPSVPYTITIGGVVVASAVLASPVPVSATWSTVTVPITWNAPTVATNQNLPYVLEITDPTQGLEATTSVITVLAAPPATPRLISCPGAVSVGVGSTTNLSARYWSNQASVPSCATGGFSDVTSSATWTSSVPARATVTSAGTRGVVTGIASGSAQISASYSGLSVLTAATVVGAPTSITVAIIPATKFVRSGTISDLRLSVNANVNLTCTLTGANSSPNVFSHTASATVQHYDLFQTGVMNSTKKLTLRCVNPLNVTQTGEATVEIEVIPTVKEV